MDITLISLALKPSVLISFCGMTRHTNTLRHGDYREGIMFCHTGNCEMSRPTAKFCLNSDARASTLKRCFVKTTICLSMSLILLYKITLVVGGVLLSPCYLRHPPVCCYQHRTVWHQALPLLILQAHKSALSVRQYSPRLSTFCPLLSAL